MPSKLDSKDLNEKYNKLKLFVNRKAKIVTNKKISLFFGYDKNLRTRYATISKTPWGFQLEMNRQVASKNNIETLKGIVLHELAHIPYLEKTKRKVGHVKGHNEQNFKRTAKKLGVPTLYQQEFTSGKDNLSGAVVKKRSNN